MVKVWAHRGASAHAPENTLEAFGLAIEAGADGVEFDVQLSSDRHPVVIHDETLERTTNGTGLVKDHTLAELTALDASGGAEGFAGVRIPTLAEVLELISASTLWVNIELKNSEVDYPGLEQIVLDAVAAAGMADRAVYSSFSADSVRRLVRLAPTAPVAFIYSRPPLFPLQAARRLGVNGMHPDQRLLPGAWWVRWAHRRSVAVRTWVVNSPARMRALIADGVDGFFTDDPALALTVRAASDANGAGG
jgi:glycerophosphoryl diester phosphodiesterase